MAVQVKVQYCGDRFATFLLEKPTYESLIAGIEQNCSSMSTLENENIRIRYKDEDDDYVNVTLNDSFAFKEMICTARQVEHKDYKKFFIIAQEVNSPAPRKIRKIGCEA